MNINRHKPKAEDTEVQLKPIEPLIIKEVHGIRGRLKRLLSQTSVIVGLSIGAGAAAGHYAQEAFRGVTGYNPKPAATTPATDTYEEEDAQAEEYTEEDSDEANSLIEQAKQELKKAKEWGSKKIKTATDKIKGTKTYQKAKKKMDSKYAKLQKIDKNIYWYSFLFTFLATLILGKSLTANWKTLNTLAAIEDKMNELVARVNTGGKLSSVDKDEIRKAVDEFRRTAGGDPDLKG